MRSVAWGRARPTLPGRFAARVLDCIDLPAKQMIDYIRKGVADFTERKFLDDDGTLFIVKAV